MKNNKIIIIVVAVVVLILAVLVSYFLFYQGNSKTTKAQPQTVMQQDEAIPTLMPADVGLSINLIKMGKFADNGIELTVTKIVDIAAIDYEMAYTSKGNIPRGAIGHVDIKPTDTVFTQQLPFGTCSDKCHFDTEVANIKVTMKISKKDGKFYQLVQPFSL